MRNQRLRPTVIKRVQIPGTLVVPAMALRVTRSSVATKNGQVASKEDELDQAKAPAKKAKAAARKAKAKQNITSEQSPKI